jgi:hypothetical protein
LDRPLRPEDVVTPLAVNPTTKRTRKGGFSRRNPEAAKEHQTRQQQKQQQRRNKKEAEPHLSEQEELELQQAWEQLRSQPLHSFGESTKTSLFRIVQLGDKQRRAWIPKAAMNLSEMGTQEEMERFIQATAARAQHPRQVELLEKLLSRIQGRESSPVPRPLKKQSTTVQRHTPSLDSEPWTTACTMVQDISIRMLEEDDASILRLSCPPVFVDTVEQLTALKNRMQSCPLLLVAIDTEWWYDQESKTTAVATIQITYMKEDTKSIPSAYVVDLVCCPASEDYRKLVQEWIRVILESETIMVLGFAFGHDLPMLERFVGTKLGTRSLLDLQDVLAQDGASLPGLKACSARYSSIPLSKEQQCSNWAHRPLSQVQLDYAGLDAAILPVLLAEYVKQRNEQD